MADLTMTIAQLSSQKKELDTKIKELEKKNNEVFQETKDLDADSKRFDEIQKLNNKSSQLSITLTRTSIALITIPNNSPGASIKASIGKLDGAINDIQDLKKLQGTVAEVIKGIDNIIGIISFL